MRRSCGASFTNIALGQVRAPARPLEAERQARARVVPDSSPTASTRVTTTPSAQWLERAREPGGCHGGESPGIAPGRIRPAAASSPFQPSWSGRAAGQLEVIAERDRREPTPRGRGPAQGFIAARIS